MNEDLEYCRQHLKGAYHMLNFNNSILGNNPQYNENINEELKKTEGQCAKLEGLFTVIPGFLKSSINKEIII